MCIGLPGRIMAVSDDGIDRVAEVDFGTQMRTVSIITLPDVAVGEWIVVHSGFAVRRLTTAEATEAVQHFREHH